MSYHSFVLFFHVLSGTGALLTGVVPMVAKKGGRAHVRFGLVYYYSMAGVAATTLLLFIAHPERAFLQFLLCIAAFSFYLTFTGRRVVIRKNERAKMKGTGKANKWDWAASYGMLALGPLMAIVGVYIFVPFLIGRAGFSFYGILYLVFGYLSVGLARQDLSIYPNENQAVKLQWFYHHIVRMLSAYIATFTAFTVVNIHFLPGLVVWTTPGILGGVAIGQTVKYYKKIYTEKMTVAAL